MFILGLAIRLANLGYLSLIGDEPVTYLAARAILSKGIPVLDSGLWFFRGLPYTYLTALSQFFFRDIEFGVRFPSALAGALTGVCVYFLADELFDGKKWVAGLVSLVFVVHPWAVEFGRFARMYSFFTLLYTVSILLFYLGFVQDKSRYRFWFAFTYVLAIMTHLPGLALLALFAFRLVAKGWRSLFKGEVLGYIAALTIISIIIFLLPATVFYGISVERPPDTQLTWGDTNVFEKASYLQTDLLLELFYALPAAFVWMTASLIVFVLTLPFRRQSANSKAILFLVFCLIVLLGSLSVWNYKANLRYITHVLPLMLIFCYYTTIDLIGFFAPKRLQTNNFILIGIGLLSLISAYPLESIAAINRNYGDSFYSPTRFGRTLPAVFFNHHFVDYYPDTESISNFIKAKHLPGDTVLVAGIPESFSPYLEGAIDYCIRVPRTSSESMAFYNDEGIAHNIYTNTPYISSMQGILDQIATHERVWIISTYSVARSQEVPPSISRWLKAHSPNIAFIARDGQSKVYLFRRSDFSNQPWNLADALGDLKVEGGGYSLAWNPPTETWQSSVDTRLVGRIGPEAEQTVVLSPVSDETPTSATIQLPQYALSHLQLATRLAPEALGYSNGSALMVDLLTDDLTEKPIYHTKVDKPKWTCAELDLTKSDGGKLRLISNALGEANFDWLTVQGLIYPANASWSLDDHLCSVQVQANQKLLAWTPTGHYDAGGRALVQSSLLPVSGVVHPHQIFLHPAIESGFTYLEFEIPNNPYSVLTASFGLADEAVGQSNGVQYTVSVLTPSDHPNNLLTTHVISNTWQEKSFDISTYLNQNIHIQLSVDAAGNVNYDWLLVALRLGNPSEQ
ncbi:MAG: glycosyltransferase family 39 protein [Chloroflexi bacterium]|nr:glycosyltransferase family 39 protein [Chloroflexota bacterium]